MQTKETKLYEEARVELAKAFNRGYSRGIAERLDHAVIAPVVNLPFPIDVPRNEILDGTWRARQQAEIFEDAGWRAAMAGGPGTPRLVDAESSPDGPVAMMEKICRWHVVPGQ